MIDLYDTDLTAAVWRVGRCGTENPGTSDPGTDSCVEFTEIPGHPGALALRDSKLGAGSPELRFSAAELAAFAQRDPA